MTSTDVPTPTAPPPVPAPPPAPAPPPGPAPPRKPVLPLVLFAGAILAIIAGFVVVPGLLSGSPSSTAAAKNGPATCTNARAYPDGRNGVAVYVSVPGPEVVNVDVIAGMGHDYHLIQQVTKRGGGARFDFGETGPPFSISVYEEKSGVMCEVPVP